MNSECRECLIYISKPLAAIAFIAAFSLGSLGGANGKGYLTPEAVQNCMDGEPYGVRESNCAECREVEKGQDCAVMSLQDVQVDDKTKPLYGPRLNSEPGYESLEACQDEMDGHCNALDPDPEYEVRPVCAGDGEEPETYELYCAAREPQGYDKKTVTRLLPDQDKIDARESAKQAREQERSARMDRLRSALSDSGVDQVLKDLIRQAVPEVEK